MPCLSARPERGRTCTSYPVGMASAKPVATACRPPGPSVTSSAATTSSPAAPSVAREGSGRPAPWGRRRTSTSTGGFKRIGNPFDEAARDRVLGAFIPAFDAGRRDEVHPVVGAAHHGFGSAAGNVIGDDPVGTLARALGGGMGDHVLRLRRKADQQAGALGVLGEA